MEMNRPVFIALVAAAFFFGIAWNLGGPPAGHIMELRNLIAAREMADTGRFMLPTMNGELRLAKPPLPTWLASLAARFGNGYRDLTSMRLPTVLISLLGALSAASYARALKLESGASWLAALILPTAFLYARESRLATWDVPAHAFAMAGIAALVSSKQGQRTGLLLLSGAFFAASMLSKGPVSLAVLVLPWLIATACLRRADLRIGWRGLALLGCVTLTLGLAWPLIAYLQAPDISVATIAREARTWTSRHTRPIWFYATAPLMMGFWTPTALAVLFSPWLAPRFSSRHETRVLLVWTGLALILVALVPMKKDRYLLPVLFPWSIAVAHWWSSARDVGGRAFRILARAQLYWALALLIAAAAALTALFFHDPLGERDIAVCVALLVSGLTAAVLIAFRARDLYGRVYFTTFFVALAVTAAGWQIQSRVDLPHVRKFAFEDIGRREGRLSLPAFSPKSASLSLVWDIGRPLRPPPERRSDLEHAMAEAGMRQPWRALWLAPFSSRRDDSCSQIDVSGVTVTVEHEEIFTRHEERGAVFYCLSIVGLAPSDGLR